MDVLAGRVLLHPRDLARTRAFYRDTLGLAVYREFGDPADPAVVFFLGGGFLEVGPAPGREGSDDEVPGREAAGTIRLWLQVRDVQAEHDRLEAAGATVIRAPKRELWGLDEMWIADPDGVHIGLVEVPEDHPLRRDVRSL
jgi:catechol 2,3-dioxygenase-like lactoylglutathione lyase family enzyme